MAMKINYRGSTGLYAKIKQTNVKNQRVTIQVRDASKASTKMITDPETGIETEVDDTPTMDKEVKPMDIVVQTYSDADKQFKKELIEMPDAHYDPNAKDKDPINQAYMIARGNLEVVENVFEEGQKVV